MVDRGQSRQSGHRFSTQTVAVDISGQVRERCVSGSPGKASKDTRTCRRLLRGDVPSLVLHFQVPVQSLKYVYDCSSIARPVRTGQ